MPEGDAVRRTALRLDAALVGRQLTKADLRFPAVATVDLVGMTCDTTAVVGKHLLTRLRGDRGGLTLHSHLRMEGSWATCAAGPRPCTGPAWQMRAWLATAETQAVGMRLGMLDVVRTEDEHRLVGHLGPDILGPDFDPAAIARRVSDCGARPLAETLLDQTVISGLGTIWTSETAFRAGASPWLPAEQVPRLEDALSETRAMMQRAVLARSRAQLPAYAVYGRAGRHCRRCGTPIRTGRAGAAPMDRVTYWCPTCQPGPAADPRHLPR